MQLTFHCPVCGQLNRTSDDSSARVACAHCDWQRTLPDPPSTITHCAVCGNADLWRQKDFPQWLGLLVVAAGALLSSIAWYLHRPLTALGLLMAFALADMLVYIVMPDVLVCYRCRARHRIEPATAAAHAAFSHETAERYRQQDIRQRAAERSRPA